MASDDWYSKENINARAVEKLRIDNHDFNNEIAGRDTGKISRFVSDAERDQRNGKSASEKSLRSALEAMLANPVYAAAYQDTMNAVNDADAAVYDALVESADKLQDTNDALKEAQEHGASAEEITRLQKEHDDAKERHRRMQEHEAELAAIRARMEDENNPPSEQELDEYKTRAQEIERDAVTGRNNDNDLDIDRSKIVPGAELNLGPASP